TRSATRKAAAGTGPAIPRTEARRARRLRLLARGGPVQVCGLIPQDDAVGDVVGVAALLVTAEDAHDLAVAVHPGAAARAAGEARALDALLRGAVDRRLVGADDGELLRAGVPRDGDGGGAGLPPRDELVGPDDVLDVDTVDGLQRREGDVAVL